MQIAYLVHDLNDAAVARRVAMLRHGGHEVQLAGFHRGSAPAVVAGVVPVPLGETGDGRLKARLLSVVRQRLFSRRLRALGQGADMLMARNLEMLVLAVGVRRRGQRLVYECLDVHRLLLGQGWPSRLLRAAEGWAMRRLDLLVTSAPAFLDAYFQRRRGYRGPALLLENKVPALEGLRPPGACAKAGGEPWVIGWFGMLRCRKSLMLLGQIAAASRGRVEVLIAGRPSVAEFPDFMALVEAMPGVRYAGVYEAEDLPRLYGQIHFIWAVDYFEEGLNSRWLLPNRLYEGLAHGAVPIAQHGVATGAWLARRGAGVVLGDPQAELPGWLGALDAAAFARLQARVGAISAHDVWLLPGECRAALARITGLSSPIAEAA